MLKKSEEELRILNDQKDQYLAIINSDLEQATNYVRSLLPDPIDSQHLKIQWKIVPSVQLGGDSFGYHWIDKEHFAIYILDVTGHGIDAALHSVSALNTLKFQNLKNTDFRNPDEVLKGLNSVFQMTEHSAKFITMWYIVLNSATGELTFAGAGHPPMIIFNEEGIPGKIFSQNVLIGIDDQFEFHFDTYNISGLTRIYVYTDGVYEASLPDGSMMQIDDLVNFLSRHINESATEIELLYNYLVELKSGRSLDDDFTIMKISISKNET